MKSTLMIALTAAAALAAHNVLAEEIVESYDEMTFVLGTGSSPTPVDPDPEPGTTVWNVGEEATAFVQDGVLYVRGSGTVTNAPWMSAAGSVQKVKIAEDVTSIPSGALDGMTGLTHVNGMALSVFNDVSAGAVKSGGFTAIAIDPSSQTGTVTFRVKTAPAVDTPEGDWTAVDATGITTDATAIHVPVPADSPAGFFKVVPD